MFKEKEVKITIKTENDSSYAYYNVRIDDIILGDSLPVDTVVKTGNHTLSWTYDYLGLMEPETFSQTINVKEDGEVFEIFQDTVNKK